MNKLFVDTSYNNIHIVVLKDKEVIASKKIANIIKISDVFNDELETILKSVSLELKNIDELYLTKGPGSFTGVRVAITFAKTLQIIKPELKVYTISTLLYQVGMNPGISYIDAKGGNTYFSVYTDGDEIIKDQILDQETAVAIANDFDDYLPFYDLGEFDFVGSFVELLPKFQLVTDINELEPTYIKKFI